MPRAMAAVMMAGLVQKMSSPTSSVVPPRRAVSAIQPSSSSSPRPSSIRCTGNCRVICARRSIMSPLDSRSPATLVAAVRPGGTPMRPGPARWTRPARRAGSPASVMACTRSRRTSSGSADLGREAALVAQAGGQLTVGQLAAQRAVDLSAGADRLGHRRRADRGDHEFLEVQRVGRVHPAVEHVEMWHRQATARHPPE